MNELLEFSFLLALWPTEQDNDQVNCRAAEQMFLPNSGYLRNVSKAVS